MAKEMIRIRLKAYDHQVIDQSAATLVEPAKRTGATVSGPLPRPTKNAIVTILRATHKYKDSREQFERRTHKRLIDITNSTPKTVEALIRARADAKKARNFAEADRIRDELKAQGIELADIPNGAKWKRV